MIEVDGAPVLVKRIPLTDRELAHPHSTANLFGIPARWQYGMYRLPGPGLNAWRVNWLVDKACGIPFPARDEFVRRCATGDLRPDVPPPLARIITGHAPAAARMNDFCRRLYDGDLDAGYRAVEPYDGDEW